MSALSPQEKIILYTSLFRGRTDVFAQHWVSRDGKKQGWFPARPFSNDSDYLPLTDQIIEDHLRGNRTIGIYPLLKDNTTWFVAADFDGTTWQREVNALLGICDTHGLPVYIERSRSGNGAHVWWFFDSPYPAAKSRLIFLHLLKLSNTIDVLDGEESFDRIFPNQDYLSGKGLGNLIALPLQGEARKQNNTIFLDPMQDDFLPFADQWLLLQNIQRIPTIRLDELHTVFVEQNKAGMHIEQYAGPDIPITIGTHIIIPKARIFKELANFLGKHLNFFNKNRTLYINVIEDDFLPYQKKWNEIKKVGDEAVRIAKLVGGHLRYEIVESGYRALNYEISLFAKN